MLIGKRGAAATAIAAASADRVMVRGRDLAHDLMGRATFTEFFFLAATGQAPTEEQRSKAEEAIDHTAAEARGGA